jgi:hypothetical protein
VLGWSWLECCILKYPLFRIIIFGGKLVEKLRISLNNIVKIEHASQLKINTLYYVHPKNAVGDHSRNGYNNNYAIRVPTQAR